MKTERRWWCAVALSALVVAACSDAGEGTSELAGSGGPRGAEASSGNTGSQETTASSSTCTGEACPGGSGASSDGEPGSGGDGTARPAFYVNGRDLYDRCGQKVILRGVSEMIVWSSGKDGAPEYAEIAKTGANVVRIVWVSSGTAAELETTISNAVAAKLIPMIEDHDATGDIGKVAAAVSYWTRSDILAVLKKHERNLLLNIANEAGDSNVSDTTFTSTYKSAIAELRKTGLGVPLIIDGSGWGQDIDQLQRVGAELLSDDPLHNLMFSVHMWWSDPSGTRVRAELQQSADAKLPLVVGEFSQSAVYGCTSNPFAYGVLLSEARRLGIGWLAWSWGGVSNSDCGSAFDMTTDGTYGHWEQAWAEAVAVTDPNSIQNTSVRPRSMLTGACQ